MDLPYLPSLRLQFRPNVGCFITTTRSCVSSCFHPIKNATKVVLKLSVKLIPSQKIVRISQCYLFFYLLIDSMYSWLEREIYCTKETCWTRHHQSLNTYTRLHSSPVRALSKKVELIVWTIRILFSPKPQISCRWVTILFFPALKGTLNNNHQDEYKIEPE